MNKLQHKSWLSPFLFTAFAVISITGIMMLFHIKVPGFHTLHEWLGLAFVIAGIVHLTLNWRMFAKYFSSKNAAIGLIAAVVLGIFIVSVAPQGQHGNGDWEKAGARHRGSSRVR